MTKPTKPQLAVLRKMRDGWELSLNAGISRSFTFAWLRQAAESVSVKCLILRALEAKGLIERGTYEFPTRYYVLTPKGREAANA